MFFKPILALHIFSFLQAFEIIGGGGKTICLPPPPPNIFIRGSAAPLPPPPPPRIDAFIYVVRKDTSRVVYMPIGQSRLWMKTAGDSLLGNTDELQEFISEPHSYPPVLYIPFYITVMTIQTHERSCARTTCMIDGIKLQHG